MARVRITHQKCSLTDCDKDVLCRSWCKKHYVAWRLYGDPTYVGTAFQDRDTKIARFLSKIDKTPGQGPNGDCWEWQGKWRDRYGYGGVSIETERWKTHRLAYFLATGIRPVLDVLHSCDNPPCCNPSHLREGTPKDNAQDKMDRGRTPRGEAVWNTTLTDDQVRQVRQMGADGYLHKIIAEQYNIAKSTVSAIVTRRNWQYLE